MPLMDAYIPKDALSPTAERELLGRLTDLLLKHEGVDPSNHTGQHMAWIWVHRPRYKLPAAGRSRRATASYARSRWASTTTSAAPL
jgi:hypothetical protein